MRIISKENKQVYTGIASAPTNNSLITRILRQIVDQASGEIFMDKAI